MPTLLLTNTRFGSAAIATAVAELFIAIGHSCLAEATIQRETGQFAGWSQMRIALLDHVATQFERFRRFS